MKRRKRRSEAIALENEINESIMKQMVPFYKKESSQRFHRYKHRIYTV